MSYLDKLEAVSESISLNRYDNGWMIEVSGTDANGDWKTVKTVCNSEELLTSIDREWNSKDLTD